MGTATLGTELLRCFQLLGHYHPKPARSSILSTATRLADDPHPLFRSIGFQNRARFGQVKNE